ncbi:MAG: cytochrome b/b6 domain-containing protein, partial [Hyphomicrobiales bacterium]|nr:cytochrome b/b6 domain-containing protein [Hyphomicrobiales bacterium]
KVDILRNHFLLGGLAILLTVIRMAMKRLTAIPPTAATGNSLIDRAALLGHLALYGIVLLIGISGLVTALQSGALQTVFGAGGALPPNFHAYFSVEMHELFGNLLMALVALHVVAALYHQFIVRDGLFRRMWFGAGSK